MATGRGVQKLKLEFEGLLHYGSMRNEEHKMSHLQDFTNHICKKYFYT